ncbi:MAG: hypothetical protein ABEL76_06400, partial [Bradymonadaceae bacterium]
FILGQSTSQFQKDLVDSGVTLSANLSYYTQKYTGPIAASAQAKPKKLREAIRKLLREIYQLRDPSYYTDEQLANAKSILAARDVYGREKTSHFTHTVSYWWAVDGVDYYLDYVENLRDVTRKDIANYVDEYILGEPFVIGVLASPRVESKYGLDEKTVRKIVEDVRSEFEK